MQKLILFGFPYALQRAIQAKVLKKTMPWSIQCFCTGAGNDKAGCFARILLEENDIFYTCHVYMDGEEDCYFTFRCPSCGALTDIGDKRLPTSLDKKRLPHYRQWLKLHPEITL